MTVIDDMSGIHYCGGGYQSPTYIDNIYVSPSFGLEGELEGTIEGVINIPQFIEPGLYTMEYLLCEDYSNNSVWYGSEDLDSLGFSTEIFVINESEFDITPPEITNYEFTSSDTVDITDTTQTISYTMSVIDDMSGVSGCGGGYQSPSNFDYISFGFGLEGVLNHRLQEVPVVHEVVFLVAEELGELDGALP